MASLKAIDVENTVDAFHFKCSEPKDYSIVLELPVESSPELELDVSAEKSTVSVEGMQTKKIKIDLNDGDVLLKNLKSDLIKAETEQGNITTKSLLLGKNIELEAENGVNIKNLGIIHKLRHVESGVFQHFPLITLKSLVMLGLL